MDGHSKREVLELFNMNKKNAIARFLFLNPPPICQLFTIFLAKWSNDISRDLLPQYLYYKKLRTMRSLCMPNFDSAP